jgi:acetoin utilization protein AcuB
MTLENIISHEVPTLKPEDTGNKALDLMEENKFTQLPVVSDDNYITLVQEADIMEWKDPESALSAAELSSFKPAIPASAHPYEGMRVMQQMNLSILPVLDSEQKYLGCVTQGGLLKYLLENSGIDTPGCIVVLEIAPRNYTLYEIARICENEDVTILDVQVHTNERGMMEVTLKLNRSAVEAVVSSFERHNYHVKEVFGEESNKEDITGKYNLLMNYLNM